MAREASPALRGDSDNQPDERIAPAVHTPKSAARRPTNVNDANVPMARVDTYTPFLTTVTRRTKDAWGAMKEFRRKSQHATKKWKNSVTPFTVDISINDLLARGKNTPAGKAEANAKIEKMKNAKADAGSMLVTDKDGNPLVAVFSHRHRTTDNASKTKRPYPGPKGRTLEDYANALKRNPQSVAYDGLDPAALDRYHEATQNLHSVLKPHAHARDLRHPSEKLMAYLEDQRDGVEVPSPGNDHVKLMATDNGRVMYERTGVSHLVHCWAQQGHPDGPLTPSKDMLRSCSSAMAVDQYFEATQPTAHEINDRFKASFPNDHTNYTKAFEAGQWIPADVGPFLGCAVVWKLQVKAHQDGLDEGPAAIFCCGRFEGGELYLPDLNLKLAYRPGDLIIFLSGHLYHAVSEWSPLPGTSDDKVTPGRVGNVFFSPKISYDRLKDKCAGWNKFTSTGKFPDPRH